MYVLPLAVFLRFNKNELMIASSCQLLWDLNILCGKIN